MKSVPAVLTLVSDTDSIVLRPPAAKSTDPIVCTVWDLGSPTVRESGSDRPGADGVIDRSSFIGSRVVTFELHIFGDINNSPYAYMERLAAMTHPGIRPRLRIQRNSPEADGQTWEMELRGSSYSLSYGRVAAAKLDVQLSFSAPNGVLVGDWREAVIGERVDGGTGFIFPFKMPFTLGSAASTAAIVYFTVGGSAPIQPIVYIYGPCTNPEVRDDAGQRFVFSGLTLAVNSFVQIDMAAATVRIGGTSDASVYHLVDFSLSTFWSWWPGPHSLRFMSSTGSASVQWRDRRLSI